MTGAYQYNLSEMQLQIDRMRQLGIPVDGCSFEQCVNTVLSMVDKDRILREATMQQMHAQALLNRKKDDRNTYRAILIIFFAILLAAAIAGYLLHVIL